MNEKVLCDFIDQQTEKIQESAELNYMKWDNTVKEKSPQVWGDFGGFGDGGFGGFGRNNEIFETAVSRLKDYVNKRFSSLSNLIKTAVIFAN